ncbi:ROK family protein [Paenibacillus algicola]|nr:ROK family protein [Paenibacillus algicola]
MTSVVTGTSVKDAAVRPKLTLVLDAGGTMLKGAVLRNGKRVPGIQLKQPSRAQDDAAHIVAGFAHACIDLLEQYLSQEQGLEGRLNAGRLEGLQNERLKVAHPIGIGFAFPGPFDYKEGIALLQGVGKYDALYGQSVRSLLKQQLLSLKTAFPAPALNALAEADIRFGNDALMFGAGAALRYPCERLICLTLGTGLGSAFIDRGRVVAGVQGVPASGMLYAQTFEGAPVDDQFGRRGLLQLAASQGLLQPDMDVAELAAAAAAGDEPCLALFHSYGERLGSMLLPYVMDFRPDRILLGGQISNSWELWRAALQRILAPSGVSLVQLPDTMSCVYQGIHRLFEEDEQD